jgi:saccharopine dehydrogenase-like NADP-dependent oxidoreductase
MAKARRVQHEEFDPDPFMDAQNKWGLPWEEISTRAGP